MRKLLMSFLMVMLVIPSVAAAQTAEPVGAVSTGDDEVYRAYDNPDVYFDAIAGILIFGTVYDDDTAASRSLDTTAAIFVASLRSGVSSDEMGGGDYQFGELEDAEIGQIGDESSASLLPFELFESFEGEYGVVIVRQDAWVQVLIGFGIGEVDVVAELEAIATAIQPRWPSDEAISVREDGLRTGGVWDMTPMPEDLPDGFEIDEGFEEGPAATSDAIVPVEPLSPDADGDAAEPGPPGARDLPLIPEEAEEPSTTDTPGSPEDVVEPIDGPATTPDEEPSDGSDAPGAMEPGEDESIDPLVPALETPASESESSDGPGAMNRDDDEPAGGPGVTSEPIEVIDGPADPSTNDPDPIEPIDLPTVTPQAEPDEVPDGPGAMGRDDDNEPDDGPGAVGPMDMSTMNERLAQPFDVSFEIIIAEGHYVRNDDGSCSGSGLIETLGAEDGPEVDGELALRERNGDAIATSELDAAGVMEYDTVLDQDVCYMTARFSDVPGRSQYILVTGESVIGRFGYDDLTTGEPVLVVIGAE